MAGSSHRPERAQLDGLARPAACRALALGSVPLGAKGIHDEVHDGLFFTAQRRSDD